MRLVKNHLRAFRAFPGEFELKLPGGCSLLIYGENGSGKSSLAGALRDFIALDRPFAYRRSKDVDLSYIENLPIPESSQTIHYDDLFEKARQNLIQAWQQLASALA